MKQRNFKERFSFLENLHRIHFFAVSEMEYKRNKPLIVKQNMQKIGQIKNLHGKNVFAYI